MEKTRNEEEDNKEPLLAVSLLGEHTVKEEPQEEEILAPPGSFLKYKDHQFMRMCLIILALSLFFHLGGGYYSFPMWLNIIVAKHVDLSRGDMSLLGGTTYVSLGVCGIFVMWLTSQNFFTKRITEFKILSLVGAMFVTGAYSFLTYLVSSSDDAFGHNPIAVGFAMAVYGFGVGTFYMVWFSPVLAITSDEWKFLYIALSNVMFSAGATTSLSLKLLMPDEYWMIMMLLAQGAILVVVISFVFLNHKVLFLPEPVVTANEGNMHKSHVLSTRQFIWDLATFRRTLTPEETIREVCDLTSRQFYLIFITFILVNATSTTFMANLGVLTSNDSDTDGSEYDQIIVLILSTVGQCAGRSFVPIITYYVVRHYDNIQYNKQSGPRVVALRQSRLLNRTTLLFTLCIGLIFTISLICVQTVPNVQFEVASTFFSVGYGAMWCVTSSYPAFLHNQDQSFVLSFQQVLGALSTLVCVVLVSVLQFDNTGTFTFLLILSVGTVVAATLTFIDRVSAEPTREMIRAYEPLHQDEGSGDSSVEGSVEVEEGRDSRDTVDVSITENPLLP